MEERPESVEITSGSDGNPWGGEPSNLESGGTLLSGSVSSLGASNSGALGIVSQQEQGNGSNVGWFFVGLILAPAAMWISSVYSWKLHGRSRIRERVCSWRLVFLYGR